MLRNLWTYYRQSGWLPILIALILIKIPSSLMPLFFKSETNSAEIYSLILILVPWILALVSLILMFIVGIHQLKNNLPAKGLLNTIFSIILIAIFVVPVIIMFISPRQG